MSTSPETRSVRAIALAAFLLNVALAAAKAVVAASSSSIALTASVVDSATDAAASLAVYVGVLLSTKKTKQFPLGLYKIENLVSVVVALFIFIAGYEIARMILSTRGIQERPTSTTAVVLLAAATVSVFVFGRFALARGKKTGSPTLVAEGKHRQVDALSTAVVLVFAGLSRFGIHPSIAGVSLDKVAAAIVLIFVLRAGWELLSDGMRVLLDATLDHQVLASVKELISSEPAVTEVKDLVGRSAGRFRFIQARVALRVTDLDKAHSVVDRIEKSIRTHIEHVERVVIHYEPHQGTTDLVAVPLNKDRETVSDHLGEAPFFAFLHRSKKDGGYSLLRIENRPDTGSGRGKGIRVAEWLTKQKVDLLLVPEHLTHEGPKYVFANAGVRVEETAASSVSELTRTPAGTDSGDDRRPE